MDSTRQIIIADTSLFRSEEMDRLARSLIPTHPLAIHSFDATSEMQRDAAVVQVAVRINTIIDANPDIILVTNCALGVRHNLLSTVRKLEQETNISIRKVLLTCKKGWEVRAGFRERGLSLDGIEHVVWSALHPSLHRARMLSIFQGNPPEENPE